MQNTIFTKCFPLKQTECKYMLQLLTNDITHTERKPTQYAIPAKHKSDDKCFPISCVINHLGRLKYDKVLKKWARTPLKLELRAELSLQENHYVCCSAK